MVRVRAGKQLVIRLAVGAQFTLLRVKAKLCRAWSVCGSALVAVGHHGSWEPPMFKRAGSVLAIFKARAWATWLLASAFSGAFGCGWLRSERLSGLPSLASVSGWWRRVGHS